MTSTALEPWQRLGRRLRSDAVELLRQPWHAVRTGQLSRFWLGPATAAAVLILAELARTGSGQLLLRRWAIMRGDQPWWLTLQKVPLSLFAPAYLLPCGFAMLQVFVVFGGAQVLPARGRRSCTRPAPRRHSCSTSGG